MVDAQSRFIVASTLLEQGKRDEAAGALRICAEADDPEWSPRAACMLAQVLLDAGDVDGADQAAAAAVRSGHPRWSSLAMIIQAVLRAGRGDLTGAKTAYRAVISLYAERNAVANAWFNLGTTFQAEGDFDAAITAFERAAAMQDTPFAAKAGVNLGYVLFTERGDVEAATAALQSVFESGDVEQSELARVNLAAIAQLDPGTPSVADPFVDLASGVDTTTSDRAPRRWRIFGGRGRT